MYRYPDACIIQFAKAPVAGTVKTRLQPVLGMQACLQLHKALLEIPLSNLASSGIAAYQLCVTEGQDDYFEQLINGSQVRLTYQQGADLGERMNNAFNRGLEQYQRIIIIGSDCPSIDQVYIEQALEALDQDNDAVIGPAFDGGYVLIGLTQTCDELFQGIPWGTEQVLAATRNKLRLAQLTCKELTPLPDIDVQEDLTFLNNWSHLAEFSRANKLTI